MVAYYTTNANPPVTYAIGALNAQVYNVAKNSLVLVNLNNSTIDANALTNNLNRIYSQASASWDVKVLSNAEYNLSAGISTNINVANSGVLSSYMPDMKPIIADFKNKYTGYTGSTNYLFVVASS